MINRTISSVSSNYKFIPVKFGGATSSTSTEWMEINGGTLGSTTNTNTQNLRFLIPYNGFMTDLWFRVDQDVNQTIVIYKVGTGTAADDLDQSGARIFQSDPIDPLQAHNIRHANLYSSGTFEEFPISVKAGDVIAISTTAAATTATKLDGMLILQLDISESIQASGAD
jgi:hypothetical protein